MAKMKQTQKKPKTKSGTAITPQVAEALASEAERGYELSKARRRRVGRPSLGRHGASPRVSFRTTPELHRAAQRQAKKEGRTVSDLAREAVARYVKQ
jgi:CRISPR-associated endonuclease/helicase Cas3